MTSKTDIQVKNIIQSSFELCLQKLKSNTKTFQQPSPRIFHSCVSHKSYLFIYGGFPLNAQQFQNQHQFIYKYDVHKFQWKKIQINFPNSLNIANPLKNIYNHSCVVYGNVMYLFGGKSGKNGVCLNQLWAMNLDSFNWKRQDQKGLIPQRRQASTMTLVNKSHLFLYGGRNEDYIFNDINLYKIQAKQWYSIDTNSLQLIMPKRIRPSISVINEIIYIYGGQRQVSNTQDFQILNDFYQMKIVHKSTSLKPDIWVKKISTFLQPKDLLAPRLFTINDRYLGLLGGQNNQEGLIKLWIYDSQKIKWFYSTIQDPIKSQIGFGYTACYHYGRIYICGGFTKNLNPSNICTSIHVDGSQIINKKNIQVFQNQQFIESNYYHNRLCFSCKQQKSSLCKKRLQSFNLFKSALNSIKFPFSAFGLLIDNSNLIKSSTINIYSSNIGKQNKDRYILIQDDGQCQKLWLNQEQFLEDMMNLRTITQQEMQVQGQDLQQKEEQKKQQDKIYIQQTPQQIKPNNFSELMMTNNKKQEEKQEERILKKKKEIAKRNKNKLIRRRKQFSVNLKLGAMRLAKKMIYISNLPNGAKRIFFLEQIQTHSLDQKIQSHETQIHYKCHYFAYPDVNNQQCSTPLSSQFSKNYIQNEYKSYFKLIAENSTMKNYLILIGLRQTEYQNIKQVQLKINSKMNDILYGSNKLISKAENLNIVLQDCIDISLKRYIQLLYLKGQYAKVNISTSTIDKLEEVSNTYYFKKIDKLNNSNNIIDLQDAFDLQQCKIVELYYNKPLFDKKRDKKQNKQTGLNKQIINNQNANNLFINGILIYHKNRLIKRYKYSLGQLLKYNQLKKIVSKNYNPLKIFGFIELDQVFYSNILKTSLVNQQMLDNMYGRIKFVQQYFENKNFQNLSGNQNLQRKGSIKRMNPSNQDEQNNSDKQNFQTRKKLKTD